MTDIVGRVVIAVMGMLLVEQLYRNTPVKDVGIKLPVLESGECLPMIFIYMRCFVQAN